MRSKFISLENLTRFRDWINVAFEALQEALAPVATSGSYNDLDDKPTIPTVNNATLTIQKNGSNVATFAANASQNATANITVQELPTVSSSDNNKILQVVNGAWSLVTPVSIYTGSSAPNNSQGIDGDIYIQS